MRNNYSFFLCFLLSSVSIAGVCEKGVKIRAITKPPGYHWFGYYDKFQFDPTDRYALGMEVDFEHRSPNPEDKVKICLLYTSPSPRD